MASGSDQIRYDSVESHGCFMDVFVNERQQIEVDHEHQQTFGTFQQRYIYAALADTIYRRIVDGYGNEPPLKIIYGCR